MIPPSLAPAWSTWLPTLAFLLLSISLSTKAEEFGRATDPAERHLENEILAILRGRTNAPIHQINKGFCKEAPPPPDRTCLDQLERLKSTLQKIRHFKDLSSLREINIYVSHSGRSSIFNWQDKLDLVFLNSEDLTYPWMSIFSAAPLNEDHPDFASEKTAVLVNKLREQPLVGQKRGSQVEQLPFLPYSSSYLSLNNGNILKSPIRRGKSLPSSGEVLRDTIGRTYLSMSPLERLDRARKSSLGRQRNLLTPFLRHEVYDPDAADWEGFCNHWTAAALDPRINEFINSTHGLVCGEVYLSQGELEELFTLFYSNYYFRNLSGKRTKRPMTPNDRTLRNEMGVDELPPADFHKKVFEYLKNKKGIAIEVSSDEEVWNHPVFHASNSRTVLANQSQELETLAPLIPAGFLTATTPQDQLQLDKYQGLEHRLLGMEEAEAEVSSSDHEWLARASLLIKELRDHPVETLNRQRNSQLIGFILPGLRDGRLKLKNGISIEAVTTRLDMGDESGFGTTEAKFKNKEYRYLLFKKDGKVLDSRWISTPKERPDFLWTYDQAELSPGVQDLLKLGDACPSVKEIFFFFDRVKQAAIHGELTENEKEELRIRYARIRGAVKPEQLEALFQRAKSQGLDLAEILKKPYSEKN